MFARLVSVKCNLNRLEDGVRVWKEKDIPLMKSVKGYKGATLLTDKETGNVISMTVWDTKEDAIADEQSSLHQEQVDMYKDILAEEPVHKYYEISAEDCID